MPPGLSHLNLAEITQRIGQMLNQVVHRDDVETVFREIHLGK